MSVRYLTTIGVFVSLFTASSNLSGQGVDPEFGFLRYAQWISESIENPIRLVQDRGEFGGSLENADSSVIQPTDTNIQGEIASQRDPFSRPTSAPATPPADISEVARPRLSSSASSSVNTQAQVAAVEQVTQQPVDTGVVQTAPLEIVPASSFSLVNVPDVTEAIVQGSTTPTVKARRRSPISMEPRVRGYAGGQLYTTFDGAFIGPIRNDLDGVLSKVDKSLIGNTEVISGPYGLRHGSGFSFITIDTVPTPRYEDGWENHVRMGSHVRANGGQTYNTATLLGGGEKMGYYANVGYRKGSDYKAGGGLPIPSSYDAFNIFAGIGFDLDDDTRMVTKFTRLNQGETEYAAQFFDVNELSHYGINHSIIHQNDRTGFGYRIDGWYSSTKFDGDTDLPGKRRDDFPVLNRVDQALLTSFALVRDPADPQQLMADVNGDIEMAGIRAGVNRQFDEESSISAGADFRYVRQSINERYDISDFTNVDPEFQTGLPTAETIDPGVYVESSTGMTDNWNIAVGARLAFAMTRADASEVQVPSNFRDINGDINRDLDVSDILGSMYLTNDVTLTDIWRARFGAGYAERLPDLTERYSDGLFLSVIQSGFSRLIGNPELRKERNWQLDVRFDGEYENSRVRFSAFHAWILDYITYTANAINDPLGARLLQVINTDYATLAGFEAYGEHDIDEGFQTFGSLTYLDGRDREINQPLSNISPLEGRIGLRWFDVSPENSWGLEWGWRIVNDQDRLGTLRPVAGAGGTPIPLETRTPGFATTYIRGYLSPSDGVNITAGIENILDKRYIEHLSLRLPADPANGFAATNVFSPGITPYVGIELEY